MTSSLSNYNKIRDLLNKLQKAVLKDVQFQELEYKNEYLCYDYYDYHIQALLSVSENNLFNYLCFHMFNLMFKGDEECLKCTELKEKSINLLIEFINKNRNEDEIIADISIVATDFFGKDYSCIILDLIDSFQNLKIKKNLICVCLLYIMNNDFSLKSLLEVLPPILKDRFPYLDIDLDDAFDSEVDLKTFVNELIKIESIIDNYVIISWDKYQKEFFIDQQDIEDIIDNINETNDTNEKEPKNNNSEKEKKKKKKKRKRNKKKTKPLTTNNNNQQGQNNTSNNPNSVNASNIDINEIRVTKIDNNNKNNIDEKNLIEQVKKENKNDDSKHTNSNEEDKQNNDSLEIKPSVDICVKEEKEKAYEEKIAEYERMINEKDKKLLDYENLCKNQNDQIINLKNSLLEKNKKVKELEFYLKIINHSLISSYIYLIWN